MARQQRNDVDYFPHAVTHGKKMFFIRQKYKNDGYAIWFMLLEELGKANYHFLDLQKESDLMYLSAACMVPETLILEVIEDLIKLEEFDRDLWAEKILFNEKFIDSISDAYKKRSNACIDKNTLINLLIEKGRLKEPKGTLKPSKSIPIEPNGRPIQIIEDSERVKLATQKIAEFFNISELKQAKHFMSIGNFVRYQEAQNNLDYLSDQFTAYRKFKEQNPQYKHNWQNYIGDPEKSYQNGAWNIKDWQEVLKHSKGSKEASAGSLSESIKRSIELQQQQ